MGQAISSTQFYVLGRKQFTGKGYVKNIKKYDTPVQTSSSIGIQGDGADGVDLTGKTIIITGANSGLGKEMATYAAAKGANLYMLCRSKGRAEQARDEIAALTSNKNIKILLADVGELNQVRKVVKEFQSKERKLDCLVCNAGVLLNEKQVTSEGNEATFASHFLGGTYLLSKLLMPELKKSTDQQARVVIVTSAGMYSTPFPEWDVATNKRGKYDGVFQYAYAKRGQVLLAERWASEYPEITWITGHPGWSDTPAVVDAFGDSAKYLKPLRTPWQGAEGLSWLMSTPRKNLESGSFYLDRKPQTKHVSGPFMTEGSFTKNTPKQVDEMLENLKELAGI